MKRSKTKKNTPDLSQQLWVILIALFMIAISMIGLLDLGLIGRTLTNLISVAFGKAPQPLLHSNRDHFNRYDNLLSQATPLEMVPCGRFSFAMDCITADFGPDC